MIKNYAAVRNTVKEVRVTKGRLTRSQRVGDAFENIVINEPFAIDIPSWQHGWIKFETGKRAVAELQPASIEFTENEAIALIADGYVFTISIQMSSTEIGGLHNLVATDRNLIEALNALANEYDMSPDAAQGQIPVVSHTLTETGEQSFNVHGYTKRAPAYGALVNPLPVVVQPVPAAVQPVQQPAEALSANSFKERAAARIAAAKKANESI